MLQRKQKKLTLQGMIGKKHLMQENRLMQSQSTPVSFRLFTITAAEQIANHQRNMRRL